MDDFDKADFEATVQDVLSRQALPKKRIRQVIAKMQATLIKPGFRSVMVPVSETSYDLLVIWVASLHQFVPFCRE